MKRCISCLLTAVLFWGLFLVPTIGAEAAPAQMQVYYQNPLAAEGVELKRDRVQMSYSSTQLLVAQHVYSAANPSLEVWSFTLGGKEVTPEKFVELWIKAANSPDCDAGCSFSMSGSWNGDTSSGWKAFWAENVPAKTQSKISYDKIVWSPVSNAEGYRIEYIDNEGRQCILLMTLGKGVTSLSLDQIMEELGKRVIKMPADGKIQLQIYAIGKAGAIKNSSAVFTVDLSSKMVSHESDVVANNTTETSMGGWNTTYTDMYTSQKFGESNHLAVDLTSTDDTIKPIYDGNVIYVGWHSGSGNYIVVEHNIEGKVFYSLYVHLAEQPPFDLGKQSTPITSDTVIGKMGNTGSSSRGTHLHLQVYSGRAYDDGYIPIAYTEDGFSGSFTQNGNVTFYDPLEVITSGGSIIR